MVKIWKLSNLVLEWIGGEAQVEGNCYVSSSVACSMKRIIGLILELGAICKFKNSKSMCEG